MSIVVKPLVQAPDPFEANPEAIEAGQLLDMSQADPVSLAALLANAGIAPPESKGGGAALTAGSTKYCNPVGDASPAATAAVDHGYVCPRAGTLKNLFVTLDQAPGASKTVTVTVVKNGVATALTVAVSGASATTGNDATDAPTVAAGDILHVSINETAAGSATLVNWGFSIL